jgi:iron complex transport system ATP-binding protein
VIELKQLRVGYSGHPVLDGVDLTFREGEVMVLLGPNGSGKTTLLRTVLGFLPKQGGEIWVDGVPMEELTPRQLAQKAAYLAQSRNVPSITAERMVLHGRFPYLSYPRRYKAEDREIAKRALERADAADLAQCSMDKLSGGQRQKVYLAMVLAQDTQTVFLDEPTVYLDVAHQLQVMETARWLAQQGKAVVLVLHDLCLALRKADRLAVFSQGRLCQVGEPEQVYHSGILDRVFGISLGRMETPSGLQYYYR